MGFWSDRKRRKAEEARQRAETSTLGYLTGIGYNPVVGIDNAGNPVYTPAEDRNDSPYPDPNDVPANEHDTSLSDSDIHTSESYGTSQDTTPSYDSSSSSSYDSSSYDSSSSDSGSSGGSDF
jgi:hypothetical protein